MIATTSARPTAAAERPVTAADGAAAPASNPQAAAGVHRVNRVAVFSLAAGVLIAMLTTSDATWWQLHFSQLGTYTDFSGRTFNATVMFAGFFLAAYGVFVGLALPAHTGRRTRRAFRGSVTSAGLHLTVIGMIPIPVSPVMHDIAASGLGLSFLGMVASALGIPGRTRRFRGATMFCVGLLATGIVVLTAGFITLALFEFVAFVSMGIWLTFLPRALAFGVGAPGISKRAHVVVRRGRRMTRTRRSSRPASRHDSAPVRTAGSAAEAHVRVPARRRSVAPARAMHVARPWLIARGDPDGGADGRDAAMPGGRRPAGATESWRPVRALGDRPDQVPRIAALAH